jgi:hypothetical protein
MDDKVANEIIDLLPPKGKWLLYHQKISTGKASVTEILLWNGQIILDLKNN